MLKPMKSMLSSTVSADFTSLVSSANNSSNDVSVPEGCVLKQFTSWDNEDSLVPKKVDVIMNLLVSGVLLPLLFLVSFSTNIVNMVVFYKQGLQERINTCLFTLSLVDVVCLVLYYGYGSDVLYMFIEGRGDEMGPSSSFFVRHYITGFSAGVAASSQILSSVIALERCLCVSRPLLVKNIMPAKKTAVFLWAIILVTVGLCSFLIGIRYGLLCLFDPRSNRTSVSLYPREFFLQNRSILDPVYSAAYGLFLPIFNTTCVTVCTIIIVVKVKKLSVWRGEVSSASQSFSSRDLALTRMIVGTSVLFIGCILPSTLLRSAFLIVPELRLGGRYDSLFSVCFRLFLLASVVNSSFNFFIYYAYGSRFRLTLRQLFLRCPCSKANKN